MEKGDWRATAVLLLLVGTFACSSTGAPEESGEPPAGVLLAAPSLEGVDPAFLQGLQRVQDLLAQGRFLAARGVLDGVLAREPEGRTLEVARRFEEMLDLDPACLPALESLQRAVESGADLEANAILDRLMLRRPRGRMLAILHAYRKILDGRAVVAGLRLRLESRPVASPPVPGPKGSADAAAGVRFADLYLVVESRLASAIELEPGPATLFVTRSTVDRSGREDDAVETHSFPDLKTLKVEKGKPSEISLARFFLAQPDGDRLASRLRFEIELRSGKAWIPPVKVPGSSAKDAPAKAREVPAMRLRAADAEETALAHPLAALPPAAPEDLARLVDGATDLEIAGALSVAARIKPEDRGRALDLLAPILETAPVGVLQSIAPSLRWIALTAEPGGDGLAWRAWLRGRQDSKSARRPKLVLPPAKPVESVP